MLLTIVPCAVKNWLAHNFTPFNLGIWQPEDETPWKYWYALGSISMIWGPLCSGQYQYCPEYTGPQIILLLARAYRYYSNHTRNVQCKQVLPRYFILQTVRLSWWPLVQAFCLWGGERKASSIIPPIWAEKLQFPPHLRLTPPDKSFKNAITVY